MKNKEFRGFDPIGRIISLAENFVYGITNCDKFWNGYKRGDSIPKKVKLFGKFNDKFFRNGYNHHYWSAWDGFYRCKLRIPYFLNKHF